jgi:hypothetical protein
MLLNMSLVDADMSRTSGSHLAAWKLWVLFCPVPQAEPRGCLGEHGLESKLFKHHLHAIAHQLQQAAASISSNIQAAHLLCGVLGMLEVEKRLCEHKAAATRVHLHDRLECTRPDVPLQVPVDNIALWYFRLSMFSGRAKH